jgi:hypothetical protein
MLPRRPAVGPGEIPHGKERLVPSSVQVVRHYGVPALFLLAVLALGFLASGQRGATYGAESAGEVGRYQTRVVGSQTRLFSVAFLIDTQTGATWRSMIQGNTAEAPAEGQAVRRYQMDVSYSSDNKVGQENAGATRVDTLTGKSWYLYTEPFRLRWAPIAAEKRAEEAKK